MFFTKTKVVTNNTNSKFRLKSNRVINNNQKYTNSNIIIISTPVIIDNAIDIKLHIQELFKGKINVEIQNEFPTSSRENTLYIFLYLYPKYSIQHYPNKYIVWQIEQLSSQKLPKSNLEIFKNSINVYEISMKHYNNRSEYNTICSKESVIYNPLPFYDKLQNESLANKTLDCIFFGSYNERRNGILKLLKKKLDDENITFEYYWNTFGEERDNLLKTSKIVINIHFYDDPSLEGSRVNIAIQNYCMCVSEDVINDNSTKELYSNFVKFAPIINKDLSNIDEFVYIIKYNLQDEIYLADIENFNINKQKLSNDFKSLITKSLQTTIYKGDISVVKSVFINDVQELSQINRVKLNNTCKTGVVITTHGYNGIFVKQCLESFIRELPKNYFIVLFINESDDLLILNLMQHYNNHHNVNGEIRVIYIKDQLTNGGLTGTWNQGIDLCLENNCDVIILSNDDVLFDSCINNIIWYCWEQRDEMKYFGPISNNPGVYLKNNKCQYGFLPYNSFNYEATYNNRLCNLNGFFMVFSKKVLLENKFDEEHYFDPNLPFGGNETEWFQRFIQKGGIPIVVPTTFIYHYKLASWRGTKHNDICIYTVNTGTYEGSNLYLKKSDFDTFYFTDNFHLIYKCVSLGIKPMYINKPEIEPKLIQRIIKTNPSEFLPCNYKKSVYVDGNICINDFELLNEYIKLLKDFDIVCFKHPHRHTVLHESATVINLRLETRQNVEMILDELKEEEFEDNIGLSETNVLLRNHHNLVDFSKDWSQFIGLCRRDQISFNFLLFKHKVKYSHNDYNDKMSFISLYPHINPNGRCIEKQ